MESNARLKVLKLRDSVPEGTKIPSTRARRGTVFGNPLRVTRKVSNTVATATLPFITRPSRNNRMAAINILKTFNSKSPMADAASQGTHIRMTKSRHSVFSSGMGKMLQRNMAKALPRFICGSGKGTRRKERREMILVRPPT